MTTPLLDQLAFMVLGSATGLIGLDEVVRWSEEKIGWEANPPGLLIALAEKRVVDGRFLAELAESELGVIAGSAGLRQFLRLVLDRLQSGTLSGVEAAKVIWAVFADEDRPSWLRGLAGRRGFVLDVQSPGQFRSEESARRHYLRALDEVLG